MKISKNQACHYCKYFLLFFAVLIFTSKNSFSQNYEDGITELATELAKKIEQTGKKKVAVYNLNNLSKQVSELGVFLAEELSVSLANEGKNIEVIDRSRVEDLIQENNLARKGYIDPETAKSLGKLAGVELLVTGTLTPIGEYFRLSVKILDIETATVKGAGKKSISRTKDLDTMNSQVLRFPDKKSQSSDTSDDAHNKDKESINIEGTWFCDNHGVYVLTQKGNKIKGIAKGVKTNDSWGNNHLKGGEIKGTVEVDGSIILKITWGNGTFSEDHIFLVEDGYKITGSWHWYTNPSKRSKKAEGDYFAVKVK